jgi:NADPH:quinone reductase-like Zn-dependent oxidoreductase
MTSQIQHAAGTGDKSSVAAGSRMRAIAQDTYGEKAADILRLKEIDRPEVGDADVLIRVQAAGVHIGDWHVMTGLPYLLRVVGFGFRAPKARVRGMDVAGTVEAVGKNVTRFQVGDTCSAPATAPSPSTHPHPQTRSPWSLLASS